MPKMFGAKFPLPVLSEKITFATSESTVAAGSTMYIRASDQVGEMLGGAHASEMFSLVNYLVTRSGILRNLVVMASGAAGVGESFVYTVRVNGAPTAITCTISGGAQVTASDLVNMAKLMIGDRVTLQIITSVAAAVKTHATSLSIESPSTRKPYEHTTFLTSDTIGANLTNYIASGHRYPYGTRNPSESLTIFNYLCPRKGSLMDLVVLAEAAPGAGQTFVYTVRVNGVNTAMTVTLSGAAQLTGTDLVNVVQVDPGDRITLRVVTSLAAAVTTHAASFDFEEGDYRAG